VFDTPTFLKLTLSKPRGPDPNPWTKISVRPVELKGLHQLQFSYFTADKCVTKNAAGDDAHGLLDEALSLPFTRVHLQSTSGDIHVRISRKGTALVRRGKPSRREKAPVLAHDRQKRRPFPAGEPDPFLQSIGVITRTGEIRSAMRGKFRQINEFIRILQRVVPDDRGPEEPLELVDCGCGKAYLTFAAYHFFEHVCDLRIHAVGIDSSEDLIAKCVKERDDLGWPGPEFHVSSIAEFAPGATPDVVLSLHACDTATDEAIAQGILWGSRAILAAPCCQHELHGQLKVPELQPLLRHGILNERLADLVTDAFRALALRIMGYRTSVIEFVEPEATAKNLMIRAGKGLEPGQAPFIREYRALKGYWGVTPCIERWLGEEFQRLVRTA
jgi:SAM-dependent methyltransferase